MSPKRRYLQSINGSYRYRRRWPQHVAAYARGEFFIQHLGTSDLSDAVRMRPAVDAAFDREVAALERQVQPTPRLLTEIEALALSAQWITREASLWDASYPEGQRMHPSALNAELERPEDEIDECNLELGIGDFDKLTRPQKLVSASCVLGRARSRAVR